MNGAEAFIETLHACGVEVCFANPGTSEMQLVAAIDRQHGMRSILGLQPYQAGRVWWFGQEVSRLPEADRRALERRIGVMFQDGALFSSLTVIENVKVPLLEYHDLPPPLLDELALLKIRLTGLPADAAHKYPAQLSGGMRKRAGLARALVGVAAGAVCGLAAGVATARPTAPHLLRAQ